jgi:hypothetical protein
VECEVCRVRGAEMGTGLGAEGREKYVLRQAERSSSETLLKRVALFAIRIRLIDDWRRTTYKTGGLDEVYRTLDIVSGFCNTWR